MAYRCTIGQHGECSGCKEFVSSNLSDHVHVYKGHGKPSELLCDRCWLATLISAELVLGALQRCGLNFADNVALWSFLRNHVVIAVDLPLPDSAESRN